MRSWSLISLVLCAGCVARLPRPGEIGISVKTTIRAEARVVATTDTIVPMQGAPVPEFFGVPLQGATDVVFVLDVSGSMDELAHQRIAVLASQPPGPPPPPPDPPGPTGPPPPPDSIRPDSTPPDSTPPDSIPGDSAPPPPPEPARAAVQPRKIDVAQAELVAAIERLPVGTRMNVLFFNNELEAFAPNMIALEEPGRPNLVGFVLEVEPTGSTALAPAMRTAFLMNARRIVLLSDGLGNVGGNAHAVIRDAREAIRGGVRIDTIGIGLDHDARLLGQLASESGGLYQPL